MVSQRQAYLASSWRNNNTTKIARESSIFCDIDENKGDTVRLLQLLTVD